MTEQDLKSAKPLLQGQSRIRNILRRHHEGVFVEEQADERGKDGKGQCGRKGSHQNERDDMSQRDAAPPVMIAEFAVSHFA